MTDFALRLRPDSVCLVPESREEVTTEGGLDVVGQRAKVQEVVEALRGAGIMTSLFIDPDAAQIVAAAELRSPWIELHTGSYANCYPVDPAGRVREWRRLCAGADRAHGLGLVVNAGHGINYVNVTEVRGLPHLHECNIGHSIISRALYSGLAEAVAEMRRRLNDGLRP
jgi:pyridoxine 5-phosphate synthase